MPDNKEDLQDKEINDDEDKGNVYTEEQKKKDILLSNFQNIARYMDTEMHDDKKLAFQNFADLLIDDYDLSKVNEDRFDFYMELQKILRKDPRILNIIMNLNNRIKIKKKKERKILNQLITVLKSMNHKTKSGENQSETQPVKKDNIINSLVNVLTKKYNLAAPSDANATNANVDFKAEDLYTYLTHGGGGDKIKEQLQKDLDMSQDNDVVNDAYNMYEKIRSYKNPEDEDKLRGVLSLKYGMNNLDNLTQNILTYDEGKKVSDKFTRTKTGVEEFIDDYYKAHSKASKDEVAKALQKALDKFEATPNNFLETIKITREDRLVFIFVTFFIRYMTILMVQWCIDINIIKDFYQGFLLYAVIYLIIFWFIVMLININNITPVSYMNIETNIGGLQNMFYYFYMGTNGISRLLTHSFLIILLLLIPILLNINHKKDDGTDEANDRLSYEDRKKLTKTLSLFTVFIWMLTSIISIKY
jgi:hypothetical protein